MRICQIGCGNHARHVYLDALCRCRRALGLTLAACCDTDPARAEAYRASAGFARWATDYRAMLEEEAPDAVLVITPYTVTPAVAADVLRMGIPCLIEKPPSETLAGTEALAAVARETGTWHQVAYNRRHMPLIRALIECLRGERVRSIEYRMHRVGRAEAHFHTTAVHGFDLVSHLAGGGLAWMAAQYQPLPPPGAVGAGFLCRYANGVCATLDFQPLSGWISEQVAVVTDSAYYEADLPVWGARAEGGVLRRIVDNAVAAQWSDADFPDGLAMYETNGFYRQLHTFIQDVKADNPSPHTLDSTLDAALLAECMRTRQTQYHDERNA